MGVYIPPPDDEGTKKKPVPVLDRGEFSDKLDASAIDNPLVNMFRPNPLLGLSAFSIFVPAADQRFGLFALTNCQVIFGLLFFRRFHMLRQQRGVFLDKWVSFLLATSQTLMAGFEYTRLALPYDPWQEEAAHYRKLAIKEGLAPSSWYGAIKYYKPMSFNTWITKVNEALINTYHRSDAKSENPTTLAQPIGQLAELFKQFHEKMKARNAEQHRKLLNGRLKTVTELNKAQRIDDILEGKGEVKYNEDYTKAHIVLGNHSIESDEDFETVWYNFDPWDELKQEVTYDIRFYPKWRHKQEKVEAGADAPA